MRDSPHLLACPTLHGLAADDGGHLVGTERGKRIARAATYVPTVPAREGRPAGESAGSHPRCVAGRGAAMDEAGGVAVRTAWHSAHANAALHACARFEPITSKVPSVPGTSRAPDTLPASSRLPGRLPLFCAASTRPCVRHESRSRLQRATHPDAPGIRSHDGIIRLTPDAYNFGHVNLAAARRPSRRRSRGTHPGNLICRGASQRAQNQVQQRTACLLRPSMRVRAYQPRRRGTAHRTPFPRALTTRWRDVVVYPRRALRV